MANGTSRACRDVPMVALPAAYRPGSGWPGLGCCGGVGAE
jgi:hypothetical protein